MIGDVLEINENNESCVWEQQPDEPADAYAAFDSFLHQSEARSLAVVGDAVGIKQSPSEKRRGAVPSKITIWAAEWQWWARAVSYDANIHQNWQPIRDLRDRLTHHMWNTEVFRNLLGVKLTEELIHLIKAKGHLKPGEVFKLAQLYQEIGDKATGRDEMSIDAIREMIENDPEFANASEEEKAEAAKEVYDNVVAIR